MAFVIQQPSLGYPQVGQVVSDSDDYLTSPPLGTIVTAVDPTYGSGEFIYLAGAASTAVGSVVVYNADDFSTTLAAANAIGPVATAMAATVASTSGWYQISGKGVAKVLSGFVDNANCYLTSTAGSVDDAVVSGDYITGMKGASAIGTPSAGLAEVELSRPFVSDGL
jgi:hypothetical protein